jgi:hypothetical protein
MSEPIYDAVTERFYYRRLSQMYRDADAAQGWPLKSWLSGILAQQQVAETLLDRFLYTTPDVGGLAGDTSDLVDPATADAAWLPWLGQLVGARLDTSLPVADQRTAIAGAITGLRAGSKAAIANAAKKNLTGTKTVSVVDHSTDTGSLGSGGQWDVLIVTVASETPMGTAQVIADVIAAGQKPAGVQLWCKTFEASWSVIEAARPAWATGWDGFTWRQIEETGL